MQHERVSAEWMHKEGLVLKTYQRKLKSSSKSGFERQSTHFCDIKNLAECIKVDYF